jgi:hypothetical protein
LSIQAGLLTIHPGSIANWTNVQLSLWFQAGWCALCIVVAAIFFNRKKPTQQNVDMDGMRDSSSGLNTLDIDMTELVPMEGAKSA